MPQDDTFFFFPFSSSLFALLPMIRFTNRVILCPLMGCPPLLWAGCVCVHIPPWESPGNNSCSREKSGSPTCLMALEKKKATLNKIKGQTIQNKCKLNPITCSEIALEDPLPQEDVSEAKKEIQKCRRRMGSCVNIENSSVRMNPNIGISRAHSLQLVKV